MVMIANRLFLALTIAWLAVGISSVSSIINNPANSTLMWYCLAGLMFINAAAMFLASMLIKKLNHLTYLFILALLTVNIAMGIADQIGWVDIVVEVLNILTLVLVVLIWRSRKNNR
jgi:hypothetical protein